MRDLANPLPLLALLFVGVSAIACQQQMNAAAQHNAAEADTGTLVPAGPMSSARAAHTATSLPAGRVLVAGGFTGEANAPDGAEVYDPVSARFTLTGPMRTPRHSHTATSLSDGRVLLAGGYGAEGVYLSSAEIYDPASGTFASTGAMRSARAGHVAVRLPDHRVLLVGGVGTGWTFLASAEIYDPATGTFSPTGSMSLPRESHVAVLLADGRVLIIGGHRGRRANIELYTSVEVYDPTTGAFSAAGEMTVRRHKHDAVLLPDGRVLITGGSDERDDRGRYSSAEIFDPQTGRARMAGTMRLPRYKHAGTSVVLPGGRVLIAGGAPEAEVYDPASGAFLLVEGDARMAGLFSASAPLSEGRVLVTGGYGEGQGPQTGAWLYSP
jgi:hypothetical protein